MQSKHISLIIISLTSICITGIIYTQNISAVTPQPITQILTDSGYVYPNKDGTVILHGTTASKLLSPNATATASITSSSVTPLPIVNHLDFSNIPYGVNFIDVKFSQTGEALKDISDYEPYDGTLSSVVISPKVNTYKTPLKLELLLNGESTNQFVTIPPLSITPISTTLSQSFHKGDSLVWHTLDTMPSDLKIDTQTTIIYNLP